MPSDISDSDDLEQVAMFLGISGKNRENQEGRKEEKQDDNKQEET